MWSKTILAVAGIGVLAPLTSERPEVTDPNAPRATPYYAIKLNPDEDLLPTGLPLMQGTRIHTLLTEVGCYLPRHNHHSSRILSRFYT